MTENDFYFFNKTLSPEQSGAVSIIPFEITSNFDTIETYQQHLQSFFSVDFDDQIKILFRNLLSYIHLKRKSMILQKNS
jgi:hypothetical protein